MTYTKDELARLQFELEDCTRVEEDAVIARFLGRDAITLKSIFKISEGAKIFYKDFQEVIKQHDYDFGFKIGRKAQQVADVLSEELDYSVEKKVDNNHGTYLSNIIALPVGHSESYPFEVLKVRRAAREAKFEKFRRMGLSVENALDRVESDALVSIEREKLKQQRLGILRREIKEICDARIKRINSYWRASRCSPVSPIMRSVLLCAVIDENEQFAEMRESELYSPQDLKSHQWNNHKMSAIYYGCRYSCSYVICAYLDYNIDEVYPVISQMAAGDMQHYFNSIYRSAQEGLSFNDAHDAATKLNLV